MKRWKLWDLFAKFLSLLLLLMSCFLAFRDGLQITWWNVEELLFLSGIAALYVTLIYSGKLSAGIGIVAAASFEIWICFFAWKQLTLEAGRCYQQGIRLINQYYQTNFPMEEHVYFGSSQYLLLFAAILLGLWLGVGVVWKKWRAFSDLPLLLSFLCGILLGHAPEMGAMLCLVLGAGMQILIFQDENRAERNARICGSVCLGVALLLTTCFYRPAAERLLKYHQPLRSWQLSMEDRFLEVMENSHTYDFLQWKWGRDWQEARITSDAPELTEQVIFELTVEQKPQMPLYVKNFVGGSYDNGIWNSPSEASFLELAKQQGQEESEYGAYVLTEAYETFRKEGTKPEHMTIHVLKHNGSLSPLPYNSSIPEKARIVGDSGIRMEEDTYEFLTFFNGGMRTYAYVLDGRAFAAAYRSYARDTYTQLPQGQLSRLKQQMQQAVENLSECSYSFALSPVPEGWDPIEYFVFEQKKGYCMHFASAYALLFRISGEPARYASGYLVLPQDFVKNADGTYTARVQQKRAHAWVEVYDDSIGWTSLEVTPSDYYQSLLEADAEDSVADIVTNLENEETDTGQEEQESDLPEEQEQEGQEQQTESEQGQAAGKTDTEAPEKDTQLLKIFGYVLAGLLLVAGIILGCHLWLKIILRRREQRFWNEDINEGARAILREIMRLLSIAGIQLEDTEDELAFARYVEDTLGCFVENEFVTCIELARVIRYGNHRMTEAQRQYLYAIYRQLQDRVRNQLKWYQKVWV